MSLSFFDGLAPIAEQLEADQLMCPMVATPRCNSDARNQYRLLERNRKGPPAGPSLRIDCVSAGEAGKGFGSVRVRSLLGIIERLSKKLRTRPRDGPDK